MATIHRDFVLPFYPTLGGEPPINKRKQRRKKEQITDANQHQFQIILFSTQATQQEEERKETEKGSSKEVTKFSVGKRPRRQGHRWVVPSISKLKDYNGKVPPTIERNSDFAAACQYGPHG